MKTVQISHQLILGEIAFMKKLLVLASLLAATPAFAQDIAPYVQVGLSGVGGGVSIGTGSPVRVRLDLYNSITQNVDRTESGIRYSGQAKYSESGLYLDWYPFKSRLRFSGGLFFNRTRFELSANAGNGSSAEINGRSYALTAGDSVSAGLRFPSTMPYFGVGWGMGPGDKGWNLIADLGLAFGRPTASLEASASLRAKITNAGYNADNELASERQQFQDSANKFVAYPVARIGASYKF